jgi:hypothetical protein
LHVRIRPILLTLQYGTALSNEPKEHSDRQENRPLPIRSRKESSQHTAIPLIYLFGYRLPRSHADPPTKITKGAVVKGISLKKFKSIMFHITH